MLQAGVFGPSGCKQECCSIPIYTRIYTKQRQSFTWLSTSAAVNIIRSNQSPSLTCIHWHAWLNSSQHPAWLINLSSDGITGTKTTLRLSHWQHTLDAPILCPSYRVIFFSIIIVLLLVKFRVNIEKLITDWYCSFRFSASYCTAAYCAICATAQHEISKISKNFCFFPDVYFRELLRKLAIMGKFRKCWLTSEKVPCKHKNKTEYTCKLNDTAIVRC